MGKIETIKARECTVSVEGLPMDIGPERELNPQDILSIKHVYNPSPYEKGYYILETSRPDKTYYVPESEDGPLIEAIVERHHQSKHQG